MRTICWITLTLAAIALAAALPNQATAGSEPWIIYMPWAVSDACSGIRYNSPAGDSTVGNEDGPVSSMDSEPFSQRALALLRPSNAPGKPLPVAHWTQHPVIRESSRFGLFAIAVDSCYWRESDAVDPSLRQYGYTGPDSLPKSMCMPIVALIDTSGLRLATFYSARDPAWSPDGSRLAFRTVRSARVRLNGRTVVYPEVSDSVILYSPESGSRDVFPTPAGALSWIDEDALTLENQGTLYSLKLSTGEPYYPTLGAKRAMVGWWSQDGNYSLRVTGRNLKIWGLVENRDLATEIVSSLGSGFPRFSERSFWVAGPQREHDLCVGISWLKEGRNRNLVTKYWGCEIVVIDAQSRFVTRRIRGAFVGPVPDHTQVVVWQDGRLRFIPL